jgi:hypothetical protein
LAAPLPSRIQLTKDGQNVYLEAVESAFNEDYAMLHKVYRSNPEGESHYSPAKCVGTTPQIIAGTPDPKTRQRVVRGERENLTLRMSMGRFTNVTNTSFTKTDRRAQRVCFGFLA